MKLAVSSTAFRNQPIEAIIEIARKENFVLEFSSGLPFQKNMEELFLQAPVQRLPHNYFPAPETPFVLNLASLNPEIWERSMSHCRKALKMTARANASFYSAHAGFCVDPDPEDLGKKFKASATRPRAEHWKRFINAGDELSAEAKKLGVDFLVENNVLHASNVLEDGGQPLLCVEAKEILELVSEIGSDSFGVHLDTGHLKVSAQTLNFSRNDFINQITPFVRAIHHSDNDGTRDSNRAIGEDYWFLEYMPRLPDAVHILEVHDQSVEQVRAQFEILRRAALAPKNLQPTRS